MLHVGPPTEADVRRCLEAQRAQPLSYGAVGMSARREVPRGFSRRETHAHLGDGEAVFHRAVRALRSWAVYPRWMTLYPVAPPVARGTVVAIGTGWGLYTVNLVRVTDVQEGARRFACVLGTLPQHVLTGEERFSVTWDAANRVVYSIEAVSRVRHPLVRLGAPAVQLVQARFARDSVRSVRAAL